uniref:MAM domain-containing protein n=1 Tax=Panagrellus redivivus TaxID=6233 RepID=A0A7E4VUU4_PANRE
MGARTMTIGWLALTFSRFSLTSERTSFVGSKKMSLTYLYLTNYTDFLFNWRHGGEGMGAERVNDLNKTTKMRKPLLLLITFTLANLVSSKTESAWHRLDGDDDTDDDEDTTLINGLKSIDCDFHKRNFCNWQPASVDSADLWQTDNAVIVDSVNSITSSADGDDGFAYVQGGLGAPSMGSLESPELEPQGKKELKFAYRKTASTPILDVCLKPSKSFDLQCIDSISGPGQQQWIRRTVPLPTMTKPFRIVLRARSIHSAEDIIGIDDVKLVEAIPFSGQLTAKQTPPRMKPASQVRKQPSAGIQEMPVSVLNNLRPDGTPPIGLKERDPGGPKAENLQKYMMPLQMSKFGMSSAAGRAEVLFPGANYTAPVPALLPAVVPPPPPPPPQAFPNFPSLSQGFLLGEPVPEKAVMMEPTESCPVLRCSFLQHTCQWHLDNLWNRTDGSVSMEATGVGTITSAPFRAQPEAYFDFELWMSDNAEVAVYQVTDGMESGLMARRGNVEHNGWHRVQTKLHFSLNPIQLKIRGTVPDGNFISISNTKLVNDRDTEISCEPAPPPMPQPMQLPNMFAPSPPILVPPAPLALKDPLDGGGLKFPMMPPPPPMVFMPPAPPVAPPRSIPGGTGFGGSIFEGLKPITPMKSDREQRLAALQGHHPRPSTDFSHSPQPARFDIPARPTTQPRSFQIPNQQESGRPKSVSVASATSEADKKDLLARLGATPAMEAHLRQLAKQFGFDTNTVPDASTMNLLKRFLGNNVLGKLSPGMAPAAHIAETLRPIKPINVDDEAFERVYKESQAAAAAATHGRRLADVVSEPELRGQLLKGVASFVELPKDHDDTAAPLAREHLDFAYQNALSDGQ